MPSLNRNRKLRMGTIDAGVEGMAFIETVVKSSRAGAKWVKFPAL